MELGHSLLWMESTSAAVDVDHEEVRWVERARKGDHAAYGWLMDRYQLRVTRLAAHVLRRESDAEDIAQESFIQAFRGIKSLRSSERFRTWLFQIVVRLCLDKKRVKNWNAEQSVEAPDVGHARFESTAAVNKMLVEQLLGKMSPPMRAALILRELEGFDYDEIAAALNIPVGTVGSRLNVARAQFRSMWDAVEAEDA